MRDPYRNVVTIWMNAILNNKPYYIYGDGEQRRQFTYIYDVTPNLLSCMSVESGATINIGVDTHHSLNELSDILLSVTGSSVNPEYLPDREQEVREALAVNSFGTSEQWELKEGLQKTWEWCKKMGPSEPIYTKLEIDSDKVPKNWRKNV